MIASSCTGEAAKDLVVARWGDFEARVDCLRLERNL